MPRQLCRGGQEAEGAGGLEAEGKARQLSCLQKLAKPVTVRRSIVFADTGASV